MFDGKASTGTLVQEHVEDQVFVVVSLTQERMGDRILSIYLSLFPSLSLSLSLALSLSRCFYIHSPRHPDSRLPPPLALSLSPSQPIPLCLSLSLRLLAARKGEAAASELSAQEAAVVRDALRDYNHETRKSAELAAREADVEARAYAAWVDARKKGDWEAFAPVLEEASRECWMLTSRNFCPSRLHALEWFLCQPSWRLKPLLMTLLWSIRK